jgi:integrase/recombinase XerD
MTTVGSLVYQFFELHLKAEKGLSQASIRSYRDGIRLFLLFMAKVTGHPISKLPLSDLTANNVRAFLTYLEAERGNHIRSRNHRLAMLHTFFGFVGGQAPELLHEAERVAAIPRKRTQPPATRYLERDEVDELFTKLPLDGRLATRDKALLLFRLSGERSFRLGVHAHPATRANRRYLCPASPPQWLHAAAP